MIACTNVCIYIHACTNVCIYIHARTYSCTIDEGRVVQGTAVPKELMLKLDRFL
jgi:hypothetical protein